MNRLFLKRLIVPAVLVGISLLLGASPPPAQVPREGKATAIAELDSILKELAEYCRRLEYAAFDFVCLEEIRETIDPALDVNRPRKTLRDWAYWDYRRWMSRSGKIIGKIKNTYLYDYQCIRAKGEIHEARTLLKENGREKMEPNAELKTAVVVYGNALFGPVGFFGKRFRPQYDYRIVGEGRIDKRSVLIIDATPKPDAIDTRNLYGKAWVDAGTLDILKIEWSESRIGRYDIFERRGKLYERTPRLTVSSEFKAEKNGIRFPSSLVIEEAYLNDRDRAAVRSLTTVVYRAFRFFTVEVEIR